MCSWDIRTIYLPFAPSYLRYYLLIYTHDKSELVDLHRLRRRVLTGVWAILVGPVNHAWSCFCRKNISLSDTPHVHWRIHLWPGHGTLWLAQGPVLPVQHQGPAFDPVLSRRGNQRPRCKFLSGQSMLGPLKLKKWQTWSASWCTC